MIKVYSIPKTGVWAAVSGGVDSMAMLSFLTTGKKRIEGVVNIGHGTEYGKRATELVEKYCAEKEVPFHFAQVTGSNEMEWRDARREIYSKYSWVATAHHLDDVIEWWLMTSLRGSPKLTPVRSGNVVHPFLRTPKSELAHWCERHHVPYLDDPTNVGNFNERAKIRVLMPSLLNIYPGIHTSIGNLLELRGDAPPNE